MKEVEKTTAVTVVKAMCDCGGEFISSDDVLLSYPATYKYTCNKCGKQEHSKTKYPYTRVEEIKSLDGIKNFKRKEMGL